MGVGVEDVEGVGFEWRVREVLDGGEGTEEGKKEGKVQG